MDEEQKMCGELCRYQDDTWFFAMLLSNGEVLGFEQMDKYEKDDEFVGIILFYEKHYKPPVFAFGKSITCAPTSRTYCRVRRSSIVAIMEIADS